MTTCPRPNCTVPAWREDAQPPEPGSGDPGIPAGIACDDEHWTPDEPLDLDAMSQDDPELNRELTGR